MNDRPSAAVRIRVMKRDRFQCTYCGAPGTDAELEIDHIIPISKGGSNHMSNLTTACRACNQAKSDGTLPQKIPPVARPGARYVHLLDETGCIQYQGEVVGETQTAYAIRLFSWLTGDPTKVELWEKALVHSDRCVSYFSHEAWLSAADGPRRERFGTAQLCRRGSV